jgi:hypothetical protein
MVNYKFTFKELKKYNPMTRSVIVSVGDKVANPIHVFRSEFGSAKRVEILNMELMKDEVETIAE